MSWAEVPFGPSVDSSEPTQEEVARVEKILSEADEDRYWFAASKDGNRISHYRGALPSSDRVWAEGTIRACFSLLNSTVV